jgi:histidinol-phosphate aminotransferase
MGYERKAIASMHGYVPGKQPADPNTIKLNTNENPYPPSEKVMQALAAIAADALRKYPEPTCEAFRVAAAHAHGCGPEELVATNGGDELLRMAITTFVEPGAPIGVLEPSYSLYPVLAEIHGSPVVRVDASADFSPPADFAARMNAAGVTLALLVNPHAPSGKLLTAAQIAALARELRGVLLVDEAYVDFVDPECQHDLVPLVRAHDNLLLLRTLSKGYGLAGLRFGYGIGCASLIEPLLGKTRDSYNVDAIAQRLATAAISDRQAAAQTWQRVRSERSRVRAALLALGCSVPESQTNFLLATLPTGASRPTAERTQRELEARGVLVRYFAQPRLDTSLRITIGTPEQNTQLLALLAELWR